MWGFLRRLFSRTPAAGAGAQGERLAAEWLRREKEFTIIARNWRNPADRREEIDLVGRDGEVLVFVEVKTRAAGALVPGYHAIDERKKRVLRRAVTAYLARLRERPRTYRLDVVEIATVAGSATPPEILHFENVPLFPGRRG
ncbi:MAG: YraN family protein [Opitutaceae bacterium]|nr:YraN family protein [Opitutaceae bacterium]